MGVAYNAKDTELGRLVRGRRHLLFQSSQRFSHRRGARGEYPRDGAA